MINRFKYLIIGTAIVTSLGFTLLATPIAPTTVGGCKQLIEDNGEQCSFVRKNPPECVYFCIGSNRWVGRKIGGSGFIPEPGGGDY